MKKKFVTIDILKKLVFPTLSVMMLVGCAGFPYKDKGEEPTLKETVVMAPEVRYNNTTYSGIGYDYWELAVYKSIQISNPLDYPVTVVYICELETKVVADIPAHKYKLQLHVTNTTHMFNNEQCAITDWFQDFKGRNR